MKIQDSFINFLAIYNLKIIIISFTARQVCWQWQLTKPRFKEDDQIRGTKFGQNLKNSPNKILCVQKGVS